MQSRQHSVDEADPVRSSRCRPRSLRARDEQVPKLRDGTRERAAMELTKLAVSGPRGALGAASTGARTTAAAAAERARAQLQSSAQESSRLSFGGSAPQRPKQNTATIVSTLRPSVSGPEQDSDVNAMDEETAWCRSVQEATRSTWRNVRERTVRYEAAHGAP